MCDGYVYAIALNTAGATRQAIAELARAHRVSPGDRDVMVALFSIARDKGDLAAALFYERAWVGGFPADMGIREVEREVEKRRTE